MAIPREDSFKTMQQLTREEICYIAGFLDGDGCINAQIVKRVDYILKFQIRISITFFQKTTRKWFLLWLQSKLKGYGSIRSKNDGVSEYCIVTIDQVQEVLQVLKPYFRLKRKQVELVLKVIEQLPGIKNDPLKFVTLCQSVDTISNWNDSKKRIITATFVATALNITLES